MTREPAAPPALRVIRAFGQFMPGQIITPVGLYRDRLLHCGYCEEVKAPVAPTVPAAPVAPVTSEAAPVARVAPSLNASVPGIAQDSATPKPAPPKPLVPERPKV